ncbi:hypothetical protein HG15A2_16120 [Adhaeretor mobilis]|uniref:Uncharacterized protein n=1 Tax=Adhaeretor mobilis TaxID=1930276 RepID=A0A517MTY0_9BACT|nr:hypothetical protein HG15A2_16120 [Adhaeretor mobilis]
MTVGAMDSLWTSEVLTLRDGPCEPALAISNPVKQVVTLTPPTTDSLLSLSKLRFYCASLRILR